MNAAQESRPTEKHLLNFIQPQVAADSELVLHVGLRSFAVRPHDAHTRREARTEQRFLRHIPDSDLTHYLEAGLPSDAVSMLELARPIEIDGRPAEQTLQLAFHVPHSGVQSAARLSRESAQKLWDVHPKLLPYAAQLAAEGDSDWMPEGISNLHGSFESAQALLLAHPELINLGTKGDFDIPAYIKNQCVAVALSRSGALTEIIGSLGERWMKTELAVGPDGQPLRDAQGNLVYTRILHTRVAAALPGPLGLAIRLAKDDERLRGQQWNVQYGVTTATYAARASDGSATAQEGLLAAEAVSAAGPYKWALANRTPGSGLVMDPNLSYAPAPANKEYNTSDIWLNNDKDAALSPAVVQDLLAGRVHVTLSTPAYPEGLLRAHLKPEGTVEAGKPVTLKAEFAGLVAGTKASASGSFRLNDLRTALTFAIKANKELGASPSGAFGIGEKGEGGKTLRAFSIVDDSANGNLVMHCTNEWLRHLSACVQYRDAKGQVLAPKDWSDKIPSGLRPIFQQDPNTKFLELVPPVRTVFGVPLPADPTRIVIPVPPDAQSIQLYFGGLGRGGSYDSAVCPVGVAVTVVAEMALPMIILFAGIAITNSQPVVKLMADKEVLFAVCTVAGFLVAGGSATYIGVAQDSTKAIKDLAITLGPMLLSPATALGQYLMQKFAEGTAARCAPFFNVFSTIVSAAVTAAQLSQTICEVMSSPWVFNAEITRAIDLDITIKADERWHKFPDLATSYAVSVVYDKGATLPRQVFRLSAPPHSKPLNVKFSDVPAGGRLKIYVFFYAENGWQAGQGESAWIDAKGTSGSTLSIAGLEITTNEVPLSGASIYTHASKIAYTKARGHFWQGSKDPPTATATSPQPYRDHQIQRLLSITTAQRPAMVAYAWQATGLNQPMDDAATPRSNQSMYTLQNLSTLEDPDSAYATPPVGFNLPGAVFYDVTSAQDGSGRNFFVDASRGDFDAEKNPAGGMHLRRVELKYLGKPDFATRSNKSWGRFPVGIDRYVLHPQGVVLGVSYKSHKLWMLKLPAAASSDDLAAQATMAGGEGKREGLLDGPRALAVGLDGRVLVLEGGNDRIQAFDLEGKPVRYFKNPKGGENISTLALKDPANSSYLDLAVEAKGYLYVLRRRNGTGPENYQVDLYEPDGTFLVSTPKVAADKITVDLLRNMYTLNYEVILGKDDRTEPSISLWIPPAPPK